MKISTMKKWGILSWGLTIIISAITMYSVLVAMVIPTS